MRSDIDIAQEAQLQPIRDIAARIGLSADHIFPYGNYIAKVQSPLPEEAARERDGHLILVTAMTPTKFGEGKTTNTIGLGQALQQLGKSTMIAVREPSLGPCMGLKGGAAGGGFSQVLPMEEINLHFTGDLHAVTSAHNLLSAVLDNHVHQRKSPDLDPRRIVWRRVMDMNDRALRNIVIGLGGSGTNGVMREDGFEITAASEIMAVLCLARDLEDLKTKLGNIIVGYDHMRKPLRVSDLGVQGSMAALLKNALHPNLVQSLEGTPVFVHGGPFANIAHGCNSLIATRMALRLADYVVTEAGFGSDLGAEKFFNIKCRLGELNPAAAVLVVTRRAFRIHGMENVKRHAENVRRFQVPVVVSINRFLDDPYEDLEAIRRQCADAGIEACITDFREGGGAGGLELGEAVVRLCDGKSSYRPLYELDQDVCSKVETIARDIYGAASVEYSRQAQTRIKQIEDLGYGNLPVCMAKTPASFSDDPKQTGAPQGFVLNVTSAKVSAGAGFIVIYTGNVMTMPGLPREPAALSIDIDLQGNISGLF